MKIIKYNLIVLLSVMSSGLFAQDSTDAESVFTIVETMPAFPGCEQYEDKEGQKLCTEENLLKYIYQNVTYPVIARQNGIEGLVVVQFIINEKGEVSDIKILKGIGGGCDEETIRVVASMNQMEQKWIPGMHEGKAVKVRYNLPIRFKLADDDVQTIETKLEEGVYLEVDQMPVFPSCTEITDTAEQKKCSAKALRDYIAENLQYPQDARDNKIEGVVGIQFIITEFGAVTDIKLIKSLSRSCDAEAFRVINSMNLMSFGWQPGVHQGQKVKVKYTVPIEFKMGN